MNTRKCGYVEKIVYERADLNFWNAHTRTHTSIGRAFLHFIQQQLLVRVYTSTYEYTYIRVNYMQNV